MSIIILNICNISFDVIVKSPLFKIAYLNSLVFTVPSKFLTASLRNSSLFNSVIPNYLASSNSFLMQFKYVILLRWRSPLLRFRLYFIWVYSIFIIELSWNWLANSDYFSGVYDLTGSRFFYSSACLLKLSFSSFLFNFSSLSFISLFFSSCYNLAWNVIVMSCFSESNSFWIYLLT